MSTDIDHLQQVGEELLHHGHKGPVTQGWPGLFLFGGSRVGLFFRGPWTSQRLGGTGCGTGRVGKSNRLGTQVHCKSTRHLHWQSDDTSNSIGNGYSLRNHALNVHQCHHHTHPGCGTHSRPLLDLYNPSSIGGTACWFLLRHFQTCLFPQFQGLQLVQPLTLTTVWTS